MIINRLFHKLIFKKSKSLFSLVLFHLVTNLYAQESITSLSISTTQNFNLIGTSGTASLPTGWKMGSDWSTGVTNTTQVAGTTGTGVINGTSSGGFYNWANGVTGTSTDRGIGFLTSGSYSSPKSIIYAFTNNTGSTICSITLSWNYEKYRSGTRAFDWTFFHGNTTTAINAASSGDQSYSADADNTTIFNPPSSIAKSFTLSGLNIANGSSYYLRWTYTGNGGATNAQGLGIDDFSITVNRGDILTSTNSITGLNYTIGSGPSTYQSFDVSSTSLSGFPGNIKLTAPANFEISLSPDGPYDSTLYIPYTSATLTSTPVYVQLSAGLSAGTYNGNITMSGGGGTCTPAISLSGTVVSACASTVSISSFSPTTGTAGTVVTVTGAGFTGVTSVSLGAVDVSSYSFVDDNTITFTVPPGSSTGKITINVGSCNAVSPSNFTITSTADIRIKTQFVNPCGPDANNEFIIANTLSNTVNIANIGLTSSNGTDINWYWGGKNLPANPYPAFSSGASESCGTSGLGCFRFMDPGTTDSVSINGVINNLNSIAGCNVFRAVPADGNIPPASNVIFILGAGGCGLSSPSSYLNFSNHCSGTSPLTQYFVIIGTGNTGCGTGGYFSNSASRASTIFNYQSGSVTSGTSYQSQTSAYTKPPSVSDNTTQAAVFVPDGRGGSKWVNSSGCIPLPTILLSEIKFDFHTLKKKEGIQLDWIFKAGEPVREFIIEKSNDAENFNHIATIQAFPYNQTEIISNYTDVNRKNSTSFYRIKAISFRGTTYFSSINKIVDYQNNSSLNIYPNPVSDHFFITFNQKRILTYEIFTSNGIPCRIGTISSQTTKVQLDDLSPGMYFIRFLFENGEVVKTEKIFKK